MGVLEDAELWTGHRKESFVYELLSYRDVRLGILDGVTDCSIEYNRRARIRRGGNLSAITRQNFEWEQVRVRPWRRVTDIRSGKMWMGPQGTFLLQAVDATRDVSGKQKIAAELYDKTTLLDRYQIASGISYPAGTLITDAIRELLGRVDLRPAAITPSTFRAPTALHFGPGQTLLQVVNRLAIDSLGYSAVWADEMGRFHVHAYQKPEERSLAWRFERGTRAIHRRSYVVSRDLWGMGNHFLVVGARPEGAADSADPPTAESFITDPDHPLAYQKVGHWITKRYDADTSVQATLQSLADRYRDAARGATKVELEHPWIPLAGADRVEHVDADGTIRSAVVETMSWKLERGGLCKTGISQVVPGDSDQDEIEEGQ